MNVSVQLLFPEDGVMFGPNIPAALDAVLQQAAQAYDDPARAEALLWQARSMNPAQLEVYIALYKFYFYKRRLEEAESVARDALLCAAEQGGFDGDWSALHADSADWRRPNGPERVYLYTLKALGFIRLRRMDFAGGEALLDKLAELDPDDQVGGSVLQELAAGLREVVDHVAAHS